MKLNSEITIDLDDKRRIWMENSAELPDDMPAEDVGKVAAQLVEVTTDNALAAYAVGADRHPPGGVEEAGKRLAAAAAAIPASERPKRPEDPASMRSFGEEPEDDPLGD